MSSYGDSSITPDWFMVIALVCFSVHCLKGSKHKAQGANPGIESPRFKCNDP